MRSTPPRARSAPPRRSAGRVHPRRKKTSRNKYVWKRNVPRRTRAVRVVFPARPRLAETCGRWSRAHAAMGAELRGRNPLESHTERAGSAGDDDDDAENVDADSDDEETPRLRNTSKSKSARAPSRWARRAAAACRILTEAAKGLTQNDQNDDGTGADLAPLLADLLDRTARAAGNFAAHQSRLWPKSRTLAQVCAARRDAEAVDDAVAACLKVLEEAHARANETSAEAGERMRFRENQNAQTRDAFPEKADDSAAPAAARWALAHAARRAARAARSRAGAATLTEGIAACVRRACAEAYETAPTGNWSSRKVSGNADPPPRGSLSTTLACLSVSSSSEEDEQPHSKDSIVRLASDATRDIALKRVLRPLFESLDRLGDGSLGARTRSAAVPAAGAAALDALRARGGRGARRRALRRRRRRAARGGRGGAHRRGRKGFTYSVPETPKGAPKGRKERGGARQSGARSREAWRGATKRARAAVAAARAAGSAKGSAAKGQAYANARAALGAEEAETWRRVCVK